MIGRKRNTYKCDTLKIAFVLLFDFEACNNQAAERIRTNNRMSFCRSEVEAFMSYLSNLVTDLESGTVSKDDFLMLFQDLVDSSEPTGTYTLLLLTP